MLFRIARASPQFSCGDALRRCTVITKQPSFAGGIRLGA